MNELKLEEIAAQDIGPIVHLSKKNIIDSIAGVGSVDGQELLWLMASGSTSDETITELGLFDRRLGYLVGLDPRTLEHKFSKELGNSPIVPSNVSIMGINDNMFYQYVNPGSSHVLNSHYMIRFGTDLKPYLVMDLNQLGYDGRHIIRPMMFGNKKILISDRKYVFDLNKKSERIVLYGPEGNETKLFEDKETNIIHILACSSTDSGKAYLIGVDTTEYRFQVKEVNLTNGNIKEMPYVNIDQDMKIGGKAKVNPTDGSIWMHYLKGERDASEYGFFVISTRDDQEPMIIKTGHEGYMPVNEFAFHGSTVFVPDGQTSMIRAYDAKINPV